MTAKQLVKRLEAIIATDGNVPVSVDWTILRDSCNGVYEIVDVKVIATQMVKQVDGDGFGIENKDGSERMRRMAVIS